LDFAGSFPLLLRTGEFSHGAVPQCRDRAALGRLYRSGQPISFIAVVEAAEVSRAWLYRRTDVRDAIIRLRSTTLRPSGNPANQRATTESLRQLLDTAREDLVQLRADNVKLRDQLARSLGQQRTRP
jgi:hypothetical protein